MPNCYYYDEQRNRCNCYINKNLNELLAENSRLRKELESVGTAAYLYGRSDLKAENAKLRELLAEDNEELAKMRRVIDYLYSFAKACGVDADAMRELGVEVCDE